jgi:hypothetical protein
VTPWLRVLTEASPSGKSLYIQFEAPLPPSPWTWPLRIGYFPGNGAEKALREGLAFWPANDLAETVAIDRDNVDCDILVFDGGIRRLLQTLVDLPGARKCIGIIVRGDLDDGHPAWPQRLAAAAAESRANGFVFLHPGLSDASWAWSLNAFVECLSHDLPVDVCVSRAFSPSDEAGTVVFLSPEIRDFRVSLLLDTIRGRLADLPKGTKLPLEPDTFDRLTMPAGDLPHHPLAAAALETFTRHQKDVTFLAESSGATGMAKISRAIRRAEVPEEARRQRARRFLQQQSLIRRSGRYQPETRAYIRGLPTLARVRIGPPDETWTSLPEAFPEELLPGELDTWRLTVVLTEPHHLSQPQRRLIRLRRDGPSTECEFRFVPGRHHRFEGRITVLHRGRVLQTAVLKAAVVQDEDAIAADASIELADLVLVRANIGDLDQRRRFDLAMVVNHAADQRPRLQAISDRHAWIADISDCSAITSEINDALSRVAKSVKDYSGSLDSPKNRALLVELAQLGRQLHGSLVEDQLMAPTNRPEIAAMEYIQVVSTRSDALVPFELIYEHETPDDDAAICPRWMAEAREGKCSESCDTLSGKTVCPLGFWGVSKVIERHVYTPELAREGREVFLQSECAAGRAELLLGGTAVVAASKRVEDELLAPVLAALESRTGRAPQRASDWTQWAELVQQWSPSLIVALPHTDGHGAKATLEIGGKTIKSIQIKESHVRPEGSSISPVAALLGCDTVGTAMDYGSHVAVFRRKGAAIVIGTIATVFGGHAARVAQQIVEGLRTEGDGENPERLGEVMRSIKRKALQDGLLMALCVVAFGDADWKLNGKES